MEIFDAHADTVIGLFDGKKRLSENDLHVDAKRIFEYSAYTQVFSIFVSPEHRECAAERTKALIECIHKEINEVGISLCGSYEDLKKSKYRAILSLEGGEAIENVSDLEELYSLGTRMIAPTWNFKNKLACGIMEPQDTGLTHFGRKVISEMERLGIICDVSHLSRKSFDDVMHILKKPPVASHSDSFAVKNNPRNLTDEQFLAIVKAGGCCGINFYPPFLGSDIKDAVAHIDHFLILGGEDCIGIGSDFDGVDELPRGMRGCEDMIKFVKMLPYETKIREKIAFRNFQRVFRAYNC